MKGKIADSIIIKVGHGIMEIPRTAAQMTEAAPSPHREEKCSDLKRKLPETGHGEVQQNR